MINKNQEREQNKRNQEKNEQSRNNEIRAKKDMPKKPNTTPTKDNPGTGTNPNKK